MQTGVNLATKYPGFLGSGWVRAGEDSQVWHMLYRFASEDSLTAWEQSAERAWWLSMGQGFVRSERSKRRTGIEGWFDEPTYRHDHAAVRRRHDRDGHRSPPLPRGGSRRPRSGWASSP